MAKRQCKKTQAAESDTSILVLREEHIPAWFRHSGYPDYPNIRHGEENWWPFFSRISKDGAKIQPPDVRRSIVFWENYGDFLAATPEGGCLTVQCACLPAATRIICNECERRGWDSSSVAITTELRNTLFRCYPETIPFSSPWPPNDFVVQNPSLPTYRQAQILEAERLLCRLKSQSENDEERATSTLQELAVRHVPKWDNKRKELLYGGEVIKKYRTTAKNQISILEAFEVENWPSRIDDPLPHTKVGDQRQRLADAVSALNKNDVIRFELDGTTFGILWKASMKSL